MGMACSCNVSISIRSLKIVNGVSGGRCICTGHNARTSKREQNNGGAKEKDEWLWDDGFYRKKCIVSVIYSHRV